MKEQFIEFLKNNKCLTAFKKNGIYKDENLDRFFTRTPPVDYIDNAFAWQPTEQGWDYWHDLNTKWKNQLKTN